VKSSSLDSQAAVLLTLSLVGYPAIAPISVLLGVPNQLVSIPFRAVVLALALNIIIRDLLSEFRLRLTPFWIMWSVFWTLYTVRMVLDSVLAPEAMRMSLAEYLLYALGTALLPAMGVAARSSETVLRRAFYGTLALGSVAIVVDIMVIATQFSALSIAAFFTSRLELETLNPILLAHLGVTVFILSAWGLVRRDIRGRIPVYAFLISGLIGLVATLMAASRGPLLILLLVVPLLLYEGFRTDRRAAIWLVSAIGIAAIAAVWLMRNVETIAAFARLRQFASDDVRRELWAAGWQLFQRKPFLGAGTEPLGYYPHNTILESLLLFGVFSGALYVLLLLISTRASFKLLFSKSDSGWAPLVFFQASLGSMVSGSLYGAITQWILMAAIMTLWHAKAFSSQVRPVHSPMVGAGRHP
jgi:O-antigen ligase